MKLYEHGKSRVDIAREYDITHSSLDCGKEFDNKIITEALETFGIQRSLSMKGCPDDNILFSLVLTHHVLFN